MSEYEYKFEKALSVWQVVKRHEEGEVFFFRVKGDEYDTLNVDCLSNVRRAIASKKLYTRKEKPWWEGCEGSVIVVETESGPKFKILTGFDARNLAGCRFVCGNETYKIARPLTAAERDAIKVRG